MNKLTLLLLLPWLAVATAAASPQPPADSTALADERRETALMRELRRESECLREEGDLVWRARFEGTDSVRTAGELYRKIHTILHDTRRSPGSEELLTEELFNRFTDQRITIIIPPNFLDGLTRFNAEKLSIILGTLLDCARSVGHCNVPPVIRPSYR